jgi:Slime mold cyclic AMP receptor
MTNFFTESGVINRIDQNTNANLWVANHVCAIITCSMSVLGSSIIISCFLVFRDKFKGFHQRLILLLSINDFLASFLHGCDHAYNLANGYVVDGGFCTFSGFYIGTLLVSNVCYMVALAYYLWKLVWLGSLKHIPGVVVPLLCWGVPAFYHLFPLFITSVDYGPRGNWCYITDDTPGVLFGFLAAPAFAGFIIIFTLYGMSVFRLYSTQQALGDQRTQRTARFQHRLLGYPVIFLIQWLPLIIEFVGSQE